MIDPNKHEIAAIHASLDPLAEYVLSIGADRTLKAYSKQEVLTMIEVIVTAYHEYLAEAVEKEFMEDENVRL